MISVIIPTLNEEKALPRTLACLSRQSAQYETIVVDGGSTDGTCSLVEADPRLRLLRARRGRASQMNAGARLAAGEWLLFLHADTLLPPGALERLAGLEAQTECQAGGFRHRFSGQDWRLALISRLNNWRCRHTGIIYGDQGLFVRRALFQRLGGFPERPILEDVYFGETLRGVTQPLVLDLEVVTDARKFTQMGVWRSLARVAIIQSCHRLGLPIVPRRFFLDVR